MSIAAFSIRRRVTILMITIGVLVFGWFSLQRLEIKLLPDISYPSITVRTDVPGAPPEEIENLVSRPMEETLGTLNNLKEITSISRAGLSDVIIELNWETRMDKAVMDIREKLDTLNLPATADKPRILRYNPETEPMMKLALTGADQVFMHNFARKEIKPRLETLEGVAAAQILGGEEEEIRIEIDMGKLTELNLTLPEISTRLTAENINLPGGILEDANTKYLVRTLNEFSSIREIGDIVLGSDGNADIRLRDLATIVRTPIEQKTITHLAGNESVLIDIYKEGDANIIQVSERINEALGSENARAFSKKSSLKSMLPDDIELTLVSDQSVFINAAIGEVKKTAIYGCILAMIVLFFFLRNLSHTSIIGLAIPVSIIATFTMMYFRDISLNLMSLGGLALGIGMLVDNSIVVLENIFRRQEEGLDTEAASRSGTENVSTAVTASTLTTIAVFFPIVFVTGIAGQLFNDLAWTIAFSLLASLMVSLSLIPMVSSLQLSNVSRGVDQIWIAQHIRNRGFKTIPDTFIVMFRIGREHLTSVFLIPKFGSQFLNFALMPVLIPFRLFYQLCFLALSLAGHGLLTVMFLVLYPTVICLAGGWKLLNIILKPLMQLFDLSLAKAATVYRIMLKRSLTSPGPVLASAVVLFVSVIYLILPQLGMDLIPALSQGEIFIDIKMPVGTSISDTEKTTVRIEKILLDNPMIERVSAVVGTDFSSGSGVGTEQENLATLQFIMNEPLRDHRHESELMDALRNELVRIPGIEKFEFRRPSLFSLSTPIQLELRGDNLDTLRKNADLISGIMTKEPAFADVYTTLEEGYPEIQITFNRLRLARLGLSPSTVANMLHNVVEGDIPTEFGEIRDEIDIRVRAKRDRNWNVNSISALVINPGADSPVRLGSIAEITVGKGPSEIRRVDQRRVALVRADVRLLDLKQATANLESILSKHPPFPGIAYAVSGQNKEMQESSRSLQIALFMAIFLVYLVMASQFESLLHPFIILFSIPLALIGVVLALWLLNISISVVVFIGLIVLAGIVVNNAIVLIDTINQKRRDGQGVTDAVMIAGAIRFRPILMTATTTILGLLPMAVQQGAGVEIRVPLAITVIAGLITSTILTLFIIPTLYYALSRKEDASHD